MRAGPRERLLASGPHALDDAELLAVLLGTGRPGASVLEVARELLGADGAASLLGRPAAVLARHPGVGEAKAARIAAALELGRRALTGRCARGAAMSSPQAVAARYGPMLAGSCERFAVVMLDSRHRLLAERIVASGQSDSCPVSVREVLACALEQRASGILCVHNHPSGDPSPSPEDVALTRRLARAAACVDLHLVDHVVVAGASHCSLRELGLLSGGPAP